MRSSRSFRVQADAAEAHEANQLYHMREDAVPQALIGGGMRSTRPAAVQIWLLQWAPGASLAGWASAAVAVERMHESDSTATFILLGIILGSAQSTVRELAQRSRAIIICVEEGEGVLWELQHLLAETYLTKTLCILSPQTASATILRAIQETRESGNARACDLLQQIRAHSSQAAAGRLLVGVWFPRGIVTPIFAEDGSDYAHWCMVNLLLTELTSG